MTSQKTIREAVHGDIALYPHELDVVNTRVFQRLHGIKQLGMACLVYPMATHTRFEHSLGCIHVADKIVRHLRQRQLGTEGITATPRELKQRGVSQRPVPDELRLKIRMAALVHDLAHVPFGHTLEDELDVLAERHDSDGPLSRAFARLRQEIENDSTKDADRILPLLEYARLTLETIKVIDRGIKSGAPSKVPAAAEVLPKHEWFVADIIGNTICADLLDYARRDMRATGLNQEYDDRVYSYFDLAQDENKRVRLALKVTKAQGVRLDAVSEILNILRIRYTLSERVLFHHTKNVASAMLGEALGYLALEPDALDNMRDDELLPWMRSQAEHGSVSEEKSRAVYSLVDKLAARRLHKTVFRVGPAQQEPYEIENASHLGEQFRVVKNRAEFRDDILAKLPQLGHGDVIVYCPPPGMAMKEVWVNVLARKEPICRPLREEVPPFLPEVVLDEVKALEKKYRALWSWNVMVAPEKLNYAFAIQTFVQERLKVSNDPFLGTYLDQHADLELGREINRRAPGDYVLQGRAVQMGEDERLAASGPPTETPEYFDSLVRRAREEIHASSAPLTS